MISPTFPIYVLSGCAVVAGVMAGGVLMWQEVTGADTTPVTTSPSEAPTSPSEATVAIPGPPGAARSTR